MRRGGFRPPHQHAAIRTARNTSAASSISMVTLPTKMLRGALAFLRGASCSSNPAIQPCFSRMFDLTIAEKKVNVANKNKTGMVGWRAGQRMILSLKARPWKDCCYASASPRRRRFRSRLGGTHFGRLVVGERELFVGLGEMPRLENKNKYLPRDLRQDLRQDPLTRTPIAPNRITPSSPGPGKAAFGRIGFIL
jgi:hypothetical protein